MAEDYSAVTRASLILRIRNKEDQAAWSEFLELYSPLVYGFARKQGLQDADASDVVQDVMTSVCAAIARFDYDQKRGKFRTYLFTATRNQIGKLWKKNAGKAGTGSPTVQSLLDQTPAHACDEQIWNEQHRLRLFQWASDKVSSEFTETTWRAFILTSVEDTSPQEVAGQLGISVGAVYIAKSRVIKRIREVVQQVEEE